MTEKNFKYPILYTFRRCPYAMRARFAIRSSQIIVEVREIKLQKKPSEFIKTSPKGTVPVLITQYGEILEESLDIINWALGINDPLKWLGKGKLKNQVIIKLLDDLLYLPLLPALRLAFTTLLFSDLLMRLILARGKQTFFVPPPLIFFIGLFF